MVTSNKFKKLKHNENGLVAIVVTMIIMVVLTLIVLGFTQLARRQQRQALDTQLATQAFYAAESGINDAQRLLRLPEFKNDPLKGKEDCSPGVANSNNLDSSSTFQYTCLLINRKLTNLKYQNVQVNESTVVPINSATSAGAVALGSLTISWQNKDNPVGGIYADPGWPNVTTWGTSVGMLRIDLVPIDGSFNSQELIEKTFTAFLKPTPSGSGTVSYSADQDQQGGVVDAKCGDAGPPSGARKQCYVTVDNLSGTNYYLRMKAIYNVADVDICAGGHMCSAGAVNPILLAGAQAEIDSTGRANDVLKRIQVRVSEETDFNGQSILPEYALQSSDDICKLLSVWPGGGTDGCTSP